MKKILAFSALALFVFNSSLFAQTVIAKYAGEFMGIGVGGRALGMGGAHTAVAGDITSSYWNPAGLYNINYPQLALMHAEQFGGMVNFNYGAAAIPYSDDMAFSFSVIRLGVDDIPDTRNALIDRTTGEIILDINNPNAQIDPTKVKYFSNADYAFYFTFSKKHDDKLSYGANVKFIRRDIAEYYAMGIGFDVGVIYSPFENLFLGANAQDITTTLVAWNTGRNEFISPNLKLGTAYKFSYSDFTATPALDLDVRFENRRYSAYYNWGAISYDIHSGLEIGYKNVVAIRGGYNEIRQFTAGVGLTMPKLTVDYSFARYGTSEIDRLGDSHRISIIFTLESERFARN